MQLLPGELSRANYFRESCLGRTDPVESITTLGIEFKALWGYLLSGAPHRTTIKLGADQRKK